MRLIAMMVCGVMALVMAAWAAEPVTPIGMLLVNPSAMHRKVFKLEGVVKNVAVYSGTETSSNQSLCGADFDLEDDTGTIGVLYHVRCQSGSQRAAVVGNGMRLVVNGYMEAPSTVMRYSDGTDFGAKFMAQSVDPAKP